MDENLSWSKQDSKDIMKQNVTQRIEIVKFYALSCWSWIERAVLRISRFSQPGKYGEGTALSDGYCFYHGQYDSKDIIKDNSENQSANFNTAFTCMPRRSCSPKKEQILPARQECKGNAISECKHMMTIFF